MSDRFERYLDPDPLTLDYLAPAIVSDLRLTHSERESRIAAAWYVAGREDEHRERGGALAGLLIVGLVGMLVGALLVFGAAHVFAAPRAAQPATGDATGSVRAEQLGAPLAPASQPPGTLSAATSVESGAMPGAPQPTGGDGTAIASGVIAYADPSLGDRYLALPGGPGQLVRICVGRRCLERTSTDAGPALFEQRAGRVADVSFRDFGTLCRCDPPSRGTMVATIEWIGAGATPPPTSTEP